MRLVIVIQVDGNVRHREEELTRDRRDVAVTEQHVVVLPVTDGINLAPPQEGLQVYEVIWVNVIPLPVVGKAAVDGVYHHPRISKGHHIAWNFDEGYRNRLGLGTVAYPQSKRIGKATLLPKAL